MAENDYFSLRLRCPDCRGKVRFWNKGFCCGSCGKHWKMKDGVPILTETLEDLEAILDTEACDRLVRLSGRLGWEEVLSQLASDLDKNVLRELLHHLDGASSPAWRFLMPLRRGSRVLELGCGWGAFAVDLAKFYAEVIAMDVSFKHVRWLQLRKMGEGIRNLIPLCGGNTRFLPFPDQYFDLVVVTGVLGRMPKYQLGKPLEIQEGFLKESFRVLREKGILYIGIENRFGYPFLLGDRDPHSGLRWGNVLPRRVANIYSKLVRGDGFRTYTHSYWGLKKMLAKVGFSKIDFYMPYPRYSHLEKFFPLDDPALLKRWVYLLEDGRKFRAKRRRLLFRILAKFGLFKLFAYHFGVIAAR